MARCDWRLDASGPVSELKPKLVAELEQLSAGRKLRAENLYARAITMAATISQPVERAAAITAAEEERKLADLPPEVTEQIGIAIESAVGIALALGVERCGVSLVGHFDDDYRDDGVHRRLQIFVDQVK